MMLLSVTGSQTPATPQDHIALFNLKLNRNILAVWKVARRASNAVGPGIDL